MPKRELKRHDVIEYIETSILACVESAEVARGENNPAWVAREEETIRQLAAAAVAIEGHGQSQVMVEAEEDGDE